MIKIAATGLVVMALTCGVFYGYRWYETAAPEPVAHVAGLEEAKTDFITVAVFKDGAVSGYISFRANITLANTDKIAEAGFIISDAIHRKLPLFASMFKDPINPKDVRLLEEPLLAALTDKLGKDEIGSVKLVDIAFDQRI